ncbi:MAG: hypothetical protein JJU11_14495 [Candidatus Sumerlaeia bacterium]|nr:hypothetical protein [Candidatus Sumerlaeia bacterium]
MYSKTTIQVTAYAAILLAASGIHTSAPAERFYFAPHEGIIRTESAIRNQRAEKAATFIESVQGTSIDITIHYFDSPGFGFLDEDHGEARRAMFHEVLIYVGSIFDEDGALRIEAKSTTDNTVSYHGRAGTYFFQEDGFQGGSALQSITQGREPDDDGFDMMVEMNFFRNWNMTLDPPASNELDLFSVLLHEVTHGLGFLSLSDVNGNSRFLPQGYNILSYYDKLMYDRVQESMVFDENLNWIGDSFTGGPNTIELRGELARDAFPEWLYPPIHTPTTYSQGSSLSHWQFVAPIPSQSVMRHAISQGSTRRVYQDFEVGFLGDLGYTIREDLRVPVDVWLME